MNTQDDYHGFKMAFEYGHFEVYNYLLYFFKDNKMCNANDYYGLKCIFQDDFFYEGYKVPLDDINKSYNVLMIFN